VDVTSLLLVEDSALRLYATLPSGMAAAIASKAAGVIEMRIMGKGRYP
jgi:hypothetical protein